ncbi:hypothetical protein [Paenibacillus xerothermodurans]|uniref:Uncharacterized protein n=1 Tax=Paenibacillus xerothermodurans TaxID=1977292 RepID=A0A2W1P5B9_PAEXE|nr:hypothetical protein [Paenibacillus xerothermodurans]PZE22842.1 hypothetical protein CBW46_003545 [Paenibacillus xerothermodurans]
MSTLQKPKIKDLNHSECAAAPILNSLWERFDFSLLLAQSGIMKRNGTPSWLICCLYVVGLVTLFRRPESAIGRQRRSAEANVSALKLAQYTLSRFFTKDFAWTTFGKNVSSVCSKILMRLPMEMS